MLHARRRRRNAGTAHGPRRRRREAVAALAAARRLRRSGRGGLGRRRAGRRRGEHRRHFARRARRDRRCHLEPGGLLHRGRGRGLLQPLRGAEQEGRRLRHVPPRHLRHPRRGHADRAAVRLLVAPHHVVDRQTGPERGRARVPCDHHPGRAAVRGRPVAAVHRPGHEAQVELAHANLAAPVRGHPRVDPLLGALLRLRVGHHADVTLTPPPGRRARSRRPPSVPRPSAAPADCPRAAAGRRRSPRRRAAAGARSAGPA